MPMIRIAVVVENLVVSSQDWKMHHVWVGWRWSRYVVRVFCFFAGAWFQIFLQRPWTCFTFFTFSLSSYRKVTRYSTPWEWNIKPTRPRWCIWHWFRLEIWFVAGSDYFGKKDTNAVNIRLGGTARLWIVFQNHLCSHSRQKWHQRLRMWFKMPLSKFR